MDRRTFITISTAAAVGLASNPILTARAQAKAPRPTPAEGFWPNKARLVIFLSMQFEAGAQPERGASSPFPPLDPKYPDLPVQKWYEYGFKEGIPRMLDLWDRIGVKVTSHMVGQAVERHPELAKEIVNRGHEAAGHGQTWEPRWYAERAKSHTVEVAGASHSVYVSRPKEVAALIEEAASHAR